MADIAIVGGGFAGTLTLIHLLRHAQAPLEIALIEASGRFARGVAYATQRPEHLLNVRAANMGAFADDPGHFHRWLGKNGHDYAADRFVPRRIYGDYLESLLNEAVAGHRVRRVAGTVTGAAWDGQQFTLRGVDVRAGVLVLACGTVGGENFPGALQAWRWFAGDYPQEVTQQLLSSREIRIVGTGLTMVDACLTLSTLGYTGKIVALSRHGWLPAVHEAAPRMDAPGWVHQPPVSAAKLMQAIRSSARSEPWRAGIDALRPHTQSVWRALPTAAQRRIFRKAFGLWNVHRHRMAPEVGVRIQDLLRSGQLEIRQETVKASAGDVPLIDCTGPAYDIRRARHPLLSDLLARGLIRPADSGFGVATTEGLGVAGPAENRLFALGALAIGDWLECTAVPDLRAQAETVARSLLRCIPATAQKKSC